ncbi:unnamed protein product [Lasius platythorax]|uniref:YqaJ viral recombinase domain-containing protein n=1 Tax=Lasius platythorax TaxID=488582 RepID=A0AAV2MVY2_9HYME
MEEGKTISSDRFKMLCTYTKNMTANWEQRSQQYFYPKAFKKTAAIKHGIKYESLARTAYEDYTGVKVEKIGLVVPEINPWLGYSPDGVTLDENGNPNKLIEIKCPFADKTKTISDVVQSLNYLNKDLTLKEKNNYFAQIQLGMAIWNVQITDFIIYASVDNSFLILTVEFDREFTNNMLKSLKNVYYNVMLHHICIKEKFAE